jgi:uncharacterized protein YndB with AHSA1/START domain
MALQTIDRRGVSAAGPAAVWRLLADSSTWPGWTPIDAHRELREFKTGRHTVTEEIVTCDPERRLSYELRSGLAVRDYHADIDLEPTADGGTAIRWHTTFRAKTPGTGWIYRRALDRATQQFVAGLAAAAASAPADPALPS